MTAPPTTARYIVRLLNPADMDFLERAQAATPYEVDAVSREDIARGLWSGVLEGFILIGPETRMCLVVQRQGRQALLAMFYREGPSVGLWTEAQALWRKTEEFLQTCGVQHVGAYIDKGNPKRDKLLRFYRRLGFDFEKVLMGRSI